MAEQGFSVFFFPCYYKENPFKNNACGNHKSEVQTKKNMTIDSSLYNLALSNKAKSVVHGLDSLPYPKGNKREEKKIRDRQINPNFFDLGPNSKRTPDKSMSQRKRNKM